MEGRETTCHPQ